MNITKLTYKELADMTGWTIGHARNYVRQKGLKKTKPNRGKEVLIDVDLDELELHLEKPAEDKTEPNNPLSEQVAVLREKLNHEQILRELESKNFVAQIEMQRELITAERQRAEAAESERDLLKENTTKKWWQIFK